MPLFETWSLVSPRGDSGKYALDDAPSISLVGNSLNFNNGGVINSPWPARDLAGSGEVSYAIDFVGVAKKVPEDTYNSGVIYSHSFVHPAHEGIVDNHDYSYYYSEKPYFFSGIPGYYTFPSIGFPIGWITNSIPARERAKATLKTYNPRTTRIPSQPVIVENSLNYSGNQGKIKINGTQYTLPLSNPPKFEVGEYVQLEASKMERFDGMEYQFVEWEDGYTSRIIQVKVSPGGYKIKAVYNGGKPLELGNKRFLSSTGQSIRLGWNKHQNPDISYKIWRSVKDKSSNTESEYRSQMLLATLPNSATSYTDTQFKHSNRYTTLQITYAIQPVNAPYSINGDIRYNLFVFGQSDIFLFTMDSLDKNTDRFSEVTIDESFSIYPNPFNPVTTISFNLEEAENTIIDLYNINGQKVFTVNNSILSPGRHKFRIDGNALSSGTYFVVFTSPRKNILKKILLLK
jgi:hypothetical protein